MTTTHPIIVREVRSGYWTAIQLQGRVQLPITVADGGSTAEAVLRNIESRKRVGLIESDAVVLVDGGK